MRHLLWILAFLAGCTSSATYAPARIYAKLERIDTLEADMAVPDTRTSALHDMPAVDPSSAEEYIAFSTHGDTRLFLARLLEIEDPYSVSIFISALANVLMDRMQDTLASGQLPSGWIVDEPCMLIGLAEAKAYEIKAEDDPHGLRYDAWDTKVRANNRYCAILTEINTRRRNQDPY